MKKTILGLLLSLLILIVNGQDKIITRTSDTINCHITSVTNKSILFELIKNGNNRIDSINKSEIKSLLLSDQTTNLFLSSHSDNLINEIKPSIKKDQHLLDHKKNFLIQVDAGYGYLLGYSDEAQKQLISYGLDENSVYTYYSKYKNVFLSGISLYYIFYKTKPLDLMIGMNFQNTYNGSSTIGNYYMEDGVHNRYGQYYEKIFTNLYAISFSASFYFGEKNADKFYIETDEGFLSYRNQLRYAYNSSLITAYTLGSSSKIGLGMAIKDLFWVDMKAGITGGILKKYHIKTANTSQIITLDNNQTESIEKIFLSIGLSRKF